MSDPNNEFNQNDIFEFKNNIFFKLSDLSKGKRKHYFITKYNLISGKIIEEFVNLNPNFGKIQSTLKYGSCEKVFFQKCEDEKVLICLGNYENFNKITKEVIKYDKEKKFFLCENKNILSEKPYSEYQRTFPDSLDKNKYEESASEYSIKLKNSQGNIYHFIKLNMKKLEIKESVDLPRIKTKFTGICKI